MERSKFFFSWLGLKMIFLFPRWDMWSFLAGYLLACTNFCVRTWLHYNKCRHAGPAQVGATKQFLLTEGTSSSQNAEPFEMVQIRPASCFWKNFGVKNGVANAFWEEISDLFLLDVCHKNRRDPEAIHILPTAKLAVRGEAKMNPKNAKSCKKPMPPFVGIRIYKMVWWSMAKLGKHVTTDDPKWSGGFE